MSAQAQGSCARVSNVAVCRRLGVLSATILCSVCSIMFEFFPAMKGKQQL